VPNRYPSLNQYRTMRIDFSERFALPAGEVFSYFSSPANWGRIFGFAGVRDLGAGWFAVGLKAFPFPLVAKTTAIEPNRLVRWRFRGFWRGEGEVRFTSSAGTVLLEGHEEIGVRYLYFLSPIVEALLLESRFRAIWALGWRRLRSLEQVSDRAGPERRTGREADPSEPSAK
jgi:hypothetical protein